MAVIITKRFTVEVDEGIHREALREYIGTGNKLAHRFQVTLRQGGQAVSTDDMGVTGYFLRADGTTVLITGAVTPTDVYLTLPQSCYNVPGRATLVMQVSQGTSITTVLALDLTITQSSGDTIIDPTNAIPSLDELLSRIALMESATNSAITASSAATDAAKRLDGMTMSATPTTGAPTVHVTTADGHYHVSFALPRGKDGVVGELGAGLWSMEVDADGNLLLHYPDTLPTAPDFSVDGTGHLIYTF